MDELRWSCGEVVRSGETYSQHIDRCLRDGPASVTDQPPLTDIDEEEVERIREIADGLGDQPPLIDEEHRQGCCWHRYTVYGEACCGCDARRLIERHDR